MICFSYDGEKEYMYVIDEDEYDKWYKSVYGETEYISWMVSHIGWYLAH